MATPNKSDRPAQQTPPDHSLSVFDFLDYRSFIRSWFALNKQGSKIFSHRYFAKRAGFKTSSFVKMVIDGKRSLTVESAARCAKAMRLGKRNNLF